MAKHRCAPARRPGRMAALALSAGIGFTTLAGTALVSAPAHAAAQDIVTMDSTTRQSDAQLILDEINRYRSSLGLKPLKYSATLSQVVQKESDRQVTEEKFSHSTNFLTDPRTGPWTSANEVIALEHHRDVRALVTWWKNSPAHDKALKDPRHEVIGIGLTYADGKLTNTGQAWQVLSTVNLYGYANGGAPADASTRVGTPPASYSYETSGPVTPVESPGGYGVAGAIGAKYRALGGASVVGQPVTPEYGGLRSGGVYQEFELNGRKTTMYWSPATGANWVENPTSIGSKFVAAGRENGYGYPTTDERRLADGSSYQVFSRDGVITKVLWTRAHGTRAVQESGAIGRAWKAAGFERGYGYPVTDEIRSGTTVYQRFSNGYKVNWSSVTGQVWVSGW
ncbi:CAP domain-containing protein [Kocuria sp. M1R5S2]|uniref:CAP domain-containing protein n=1 Tax=Kocuria rhizosphaerae TaxID=3376285 RepID=UPI0037A836F5